MKCSKCGGLLIYSFYEEVFCMNCGHSPTVVSADVAAEVEQNLNRKKLKGHNIILPTSLPLHPDLALVVRKRKESKRRLHRKR